MKTVRDLIVEKAAEMQRGAASELRRAESSALKHLVGEEEPGGHTRDRVFTAWGASRAYEYSATVLDDIRKAIDRGEFESTN